MAKVTHKVLRKFKAKIQDESYVNFTLKQKIDAVGLLGKAYTEALSKQGYLGVIGKVASRAEGDGVDEMGGETEGMENLGGLGEPLQIT